MKKLLLFLPGLFLGFLLGAAALAGFVLVVEAVWESEAEPERLGRARNVVPQ
jgi:hypothetical protein